MPTYSQAQSDFQQSLRYGEQVRVKYFNYAFATGSYDDTVTLTQSGSDLWISGLYFPAHNKDGTAVAFQNEAGREVVAEKVIYLDGSYSLSGVMQIGILGSPPTQEYTVIPEGIQPQYINGSIVFNKVYLKFLTLGSMQSS